MRIRPATQSDLKEIAAIHAASWKDAYSDVFPAEFLVGQIDRQFSNYWGEISIKTEDLVLVAKKDSPVGFIAVWCRPTPFIDNLHVRPSQRSKKIGSALMKAAARELIDRGHRTGYLWVFENNEKAIRFYERLGGVKKEKERKTVFGYRVLSRKIEWDDLGVICSD